MDLSQTGEWQNRPFSVKLILPGLDLLKVPFHDARQYYWIATTWKMTKLEIGICSLLINRDIHNASSNGPMGVETSHLIVANQYSWVVSMQFPDFPSLLCNRWLPDDNWRTSICNKDPQIDVRITDQFCPTTVLRVQLVPSPRTQAEIYFQILSTNKENMLSSICHTDFKHHPSQITRWN